MGAVVVEGPKAVGKTSTATLQAGTVVRLDDRSDPRVAAAFDLDPSLILTGAAPVLLDEWQEIPELWNRVRHEVDDRGGQPGQFILTGSSTPDDQARRHSGAGRFAMIQMRPLSLFESGHSTGEVSLAALFEGVSPHGYDAEWNATDARTQLAQRIVVGGWPVNIGVPVETAARNNADYLAAIREHDLPRLEGRDPGTAAKVVRAYARVVSTPAYETTIARGASAGQSDDLHVGLDATSRDTVRRHLAALERLRIVEDLPAWAPPLRSSARTNTAPKRHFVDPSLAAAALNVGWQPLAAEPLTLGLWFESLAVRDLRIYAQRLGGRVLYYRDSDKLEIDAVVELPDGRWGAFEVKAGTGKATMDTAVANLQRLRAKVDDNRCAFLAVLTGGGVAARGQNGVCVVPLRMLAP
ncbi:MAG: DUF4143 domain-containing protein [Propionicimonas sp.]|nr:DUF4143 domain-containing protein [Propionicimonas sp.]